MIESIFTIECFREAADLLLGDFGDFGDMMEGVGDVIEATETRRGGRVGDDNCKGLSIVVLCECSHREEIAAKRQIGDVKVACIEVSDVQI